MFQLRNARLFPTVNVSAVPQLLAQRLARPEQPLADPNRFVGEGAALEFEFDQPPGDAQYFSEFVDAQKFRAVGTVKPQWVGSFCGHRRRIFA